MFVAAVLPDTARLLGYGGPAARDSAARPIIRPTVVWFLVLMAFFVFTLTRIQANAAFLYYQF